MKLVFSIGIFIVFLSNSISAQVQSDFRNLKWGMTLNEVKSKESLRIDQEYYDSTSYNSLRYQSQYILEYRNATVGGHNCILKYEFKNGLFVGVEVQFLRTRETYSKHAWDMIPKFKNVVSWIDNKQLTCEFPLYVNYIDGEVENEDNLIFRDNYDCYGSKETLASLDSIVNIKEYPYIFTVWWNDRSFARMTYYTRFNPLSEIFCARLYYGAGRKVINDMLKEDF